MSWNVGDALAYGWARFRASPTSFVLGVLVLLVGLAAAVGLVVLLQSTLVDTTSGLRISLLVGAFGVAVVVVAAQLFGAGFMRGALGVTEGRAFEPRSVLSTEQAGAVVTTSLVIAAGTFLGSLLCYLPGLAVAFLTQWSLYFVVDRDLGASAAIRASVDLVRTRLTESLIWFVVAGLVVAAGAALCGVGLLVALPVVMLGGAWSYRVLTGQRRSLADLELDHHVAGLVLLDVDHAGGADHQLVRRRTGLELDVLLGLAVDVQLARAVAGDLEGHHLVPGDLETLTPWRDLVAADGDGHDGAGLLGRRRLLLDRVRGRGLVDAHAPARRR